MKITKSQLIKIEETLKDFISLVPRYQECKKDPLLYNLFLSRNRNPLWDITQTKFWKSGLISDGAKLKNSKIVSDHFVQRKLAMGFIMDKISKTPEITLNEFILLCKKYSSTIELTKEEHQKVTSMAKNSNTCNYEFYSECGIIVEGLDELITNL